MTKKAAPEDTLGELHNKLAEKLLEMIEQGDLSASQIKEVREFLKDNDIQAVPTENSVIRKLHDSLPDLDDINEA